MRLDYYHTGDATHEVFSVDRIVIEPTQVRIVYRINTVLGLAEATAAGIGFGLLPCFIGAATPGVTRLTPPLDDVVDGLWLLTHSDLRQTARVRAFMDFAGSEIAKLRKRLEGAD